MVDRVMWKPLFYRGIDFSDRYMISSNGDLYSIKYNKIIKKTICNGYYVYVTSLGERGSYKLIKLHIAVAENFVDGKIDGLVVNHIDGNKLNNNYKNLEWVTMSDNVEHAYKTGLKKKQCGKKVICVNHNIIFDSIRSAASWCGTHKSSIQNVLKGKCKHAGRSPITNELLSWKFV